MNITKMCTWSGSVEMSSLRWMIFSVSWCKFNRKYVKTSRAVQIFWSRPDVSNWSIIFSYQGVNTTSAFLKTYLELISPALLAVLRNVKFLYILLTPVTKDIMITKRGLLPFKKLIISVYWKKFLKFSKTQPLYEEARDAVLKNASLL